MATGTMSGAISLRVWLEKAGDRVLVERLSALPELAEARRFQFARRLVSP